MHINTLFKDIQNFKNYIKLSVFMFSLLQHKRDAQKTTKYVELIIVADNREVCFARIAVMPIGQQMSLSCCQGLWAYNPPRVKG